MENDNITRALGALTLLAGLTSCSYLEERKQLASTFDAFDRLEASVIAGAGLLEYKHRLVEATAQYNRMSELDATFQGSRVGTELGRALLCFTVSTEWREVDRVRTENVLIELSEVPLRSPTKEDFDAYRLMVTYGAKKLGGDDFSLRPWVKGDEVAAAYVQRALVRLNNAKVLAGRKKGDAAQEPPQRDLAEVRQMSEEAQRRASSIVRTHFEAIARRPGIVDLFSWPSGANILIDGQSVGSTPARVPLNPGRYLIQLVKPGCEILAVPLTIPAGRALSLEKTLVKKRS